MGRDAYLGANEARALVGAYVGHQAWGGQTAPQYGEGRRERRREEWEREREQREDRRERGFGGGYGYQQPYQQPYQAPAPYWQRQRAAAPTVRDHVGAELLGAARALMGADPTGLSGILGQLAPRAYLRDMAEPDMANRQVLPMNTGTTPVPIASTAQITSRPQRVAFRPERVFVSSADIGGSGSAANWIINDITIGNRSQFAQSGALPGDMFSNVAIDSFVTFETAQTAMDVVMIVTYQGATEGGTPFYGSIIGTAAV